MDSVSDLTLSVTGPAPAEEADGLEAGCRRARALVAWLSREEAMRLRGRAGDRMREERGREALRARAVDVDQSGLMQAWPAALETHAAELRASEGAGAMFADGWELALVSDLRRVVAAQPTVFVDSGQDPAIDVGSGDLSDIAHLTLPLAEPAAEVAARFDQDAQAWIISSRNPNLRISGRFGGDVQPNVLGFGFLVQVLPSFMSVAEICGRYVLCDGYHRALRLLEAGVVTAPVFVRRFGEIDGSLFRAGMLSTDVYCGERPPTLADYHDDTVAEELLLEVKERVAVVRAVA